MSPTKRDGLLELARRKAVGDFTTFKSLVYKGYESPRHLKMLDSMLMKVTRFVETNGEEGIGKLVIEMPPRHGKTVTTSQLYPIWHLGRNPDDRAMLVSYGSTLATKNSRSARNLLVTAGYNWIFPSVGVAKDRAAMDNWDIEGTRGGVDAIGIGGAATGKGANLLIIDDPVKNRAEAESALQRQRIWEAYANDLLTRLERNSAQIIIATRWHRDDLTGQVLKRDGLIEEGGSWHRLRLPALAEGDDPLDRNEGEPLWPEGYSLASLTAKKLTLGSYGWASLYQQRPMPAEGGLFKPEWINDNRIEEMPKNAFIVETVVGIDPSVSSTKTSDETGIIVASYCSDGNIYVREDLSLVATPAVWAARAVQTSMRYQNARVVVEVNQGGDMVTHTIRTTPHGATVPIKKVHATKGKKVRAEPIAALYEQGRVRHVGTHRVLEEQCVTWRQGESSPDRMDALVWAITHLKQYIMPEMQVLDHNPFFD